ncbi:hypothetical protein OJAV_G00145000 [Oryzias javanicus]|uniref:Uncharacterized protein n=1 Tax=Oryzias javanicus TaxID=123683 RepID=A0A3S2PLU6_ORYJA|nr:hypothetical protein OJAV_G00145000 [Oryzias javanicus]
MRRDADGCSSVCVLALGPDFTFITHGVAAPGHDSRPSADTEAGESSGDRRRFISGIPRELPTAGWDMKPPLFVTQSCFHCCPTAGQQQSINSPTAGGCRSLQKDEIAFLIEGMAFQ